MIECKEKHNKIYYVGGFIIIFLIIMFMAFSARNVENPAQNTLIHHPFKCEEIKVVDNEN